MQLLTASLYDYIEKCKLQTAIDARKDYIKKNMGNPLFGGAGGVEGMYIR